MALKAKSASCMQATAAAKQIRIACYDTEADTLSMLEPSGPSPMSRGGHSVCSAFTAPHAMQSTLPCSTCHMSSPVNCVEPSLGLRLDHGDLACVQATVLNGILYIFGGEDTSRRPVSKLHVLDLASMTWRQVETTGRAPAARSAHTAVAYKVGGRLLFHTAVSMPYSRMPMISSVGCARLGHAKQ